MKQAVKSITEQICTPYLKIATYVLAVMLAATAGATEVAWNGDGAYALGADDTMTFSTAATITSASTFTGTGKIVVTDGATLTLYYKMSEIPFSGFSGSVQIDPNSKIFMDSPEFSEDNTYANSVFGPSATIVFNGGLLRGFKKQNNSQLTGEIVVCDGTESTLQNIEASSGNGVNLRVRESASFSGSGKLTIEQKDRWIEFARYCNLKRFAGSLVFSGNSSQYNRFYGTDFGDGASWMFDAAREFQLETDEATPTLRFGALNVTSKATSLRIRQDGTVLEIGGRNEDCEIDAPISQKSVSIVKTGSARLAMGPNATVLSGTTIDVNSGCLAVGSVDVLANAHITVSENAAFSLLFRDPSTESAGLSLANVSLPVGAVVTNEVLFTSDPADGSTYTLVTSDEVLSLDAFALAIASSGANAVAGELSLSQDGKCLLLTVGTYPATPHLWVSFTGGDSSCKGSVGFSGQWAPDSDVPNAADYAVGHEGDNGAYLPNGGKNGTSGRYPRAKHMSYTGPSNFTLFFTVRSVDTENAVLLHLGYFNNSHRGNLLLRSGGAGKVKLSTMDTQNSTPVDAVVADVPSASLLSHAYAIAYDFATKTLKLYVDGEYIGVANGFGDPGTGLMPDGTTVYNGGISASDFRFGYTGGNKFTQAPGMLVDDFRCYEKTVLSDAAIKAISAELGPWADGLKYAYETDATTGITTFDINDAEPGRKTVTLIRGVDTADFTLSSFAAKVSNRSNYKAKLSIVDGDLVATILPPGLTVILR